MTFLFIFLMFVYDMTKIFEFIKQLTITLKQNLNVNRP